MGGALASARLTDVLGRRNTIWIGCMPFVAGFALISFAVDIAMLFVGRVLIGIAVGIVSVAVPVYISGT